MNRIIPGGGARRSLTAALVFGLTLGGLAACGSSGDGPDATAGADVTTAGTTLDSSLDGDAFTDTASTASTDTASTDTAGAADADTVVINATVTGGAVEVESDRVPVALGSEVSIVVVTDVAEPVHLHGYDIEVDASPGSPARIDFTADVPGVFEVELEDSGTLLFEIEVS